MQCSAVENSTCCAVDTSRIFHKNNLHCTVKSTVCTGYVTDTGNPSLFNLQCSAVLPLQNKKIVQHWISTLSQPIFCLLTCSVSTALVCYYKVRCLALHCLSFLALHCRLLALHVISHVMWETGEGVVVVVVTNLLRK